MRKNIFRRLRSPVLPIAVVMLLALPCLGGSCEHPLFVLGDESLITAIPDGATYAVLGQEFDLAPGDSALLFGCRGKYEIKTGREIDLVITPDPCRNPNGTYLTERESKRKISLEINGRFIWITNPDEQSVKITVKRVG